ncbi:MAG: hypothetical protein M0Z89_08950 [Nitrospiraceae bacterium]|nr:hypothetical protein [Nitrospiraceae bacterium]
MTTTEDALKQRKYSDCIQYLGSSFRMRVKKLLSALDAQCNQFRLSSILTSVSSTWSSPDAEKAMPDPLVKVFQPVICFLVEVVDGAAARGDMQLLQKMRLPAARYGVSVKKTIIV